jgi:hypothetical protein
MAIQSIRISTRSTILNRHLYMCAVICTLIRLDHINDRTNMLSTSLWITILLIHELFLFTRHILERTDIFLVFHVTGNRYFLEQVIFFRTAFRSINTYYDPQIWLLAPAMQFVASQSNWPRKSPLLTNIFDRTSASMCGAMSMGATVKFRKCDRRSPPPLFLRQVQTFTGARASHITPTGYSA